MGRKSWQFASRLPAEKLPRIQNPGIQSNQLVEPAYNPIHRRHQYDPAGELIRTLDKLRGEIKYEYEANGQLHSRDTVRLLDSEKFRYDAAANRLNFNTIQFDHVRDNCLKHWRDQEYAYDAWGNLIEKRSGMGQLQTFTYDAENRLVRAETLVNGKLESTGLSLRQPGASCGQGVRGRWRHRAHAFPLARLAPVARGNAGAEQSLRLRAGQLRALARVDQEEGGEQQLYYFHTDQIGTPLEMADADGQIVWQATYTTLFGITIRRWNSLLRRRRLGWMGVVIFIAMCRTEQVGSIHLAGRGSMLVVDLCLAVSTAYVLV